MPGQRISPCVQIEQIIEEQYLGQAYQQAHRHATPELKEKTIPYRLQCYR